jgi:glycosyltransferase involved in cell wall biosynthesis
LVLAHLTRTAEYVKGRGISSAVEMTDAISMNYERSMAVSKSSSILSLIYAIEAKRLKAYEKNAMREHNLLCFVSNIDVEFLYGSNPPNNVIVCGNGVATDSLSFGLAAERKPVVAFIGNMMSMQNRDAAAWFAKEVLPLLRKRGDFRFRIVGQISERHRAMFDQLDGVELTGKVPDVGAVIRDCFAGVCSVRIGAGVQNKLLEYMALGLPTVTTSIGLEGVGAKDGRELWVADNPEEFALRLMFIWEDHAAANAIAANARSYVEENHAWGAMLNKLTNCIVDMAVQNGQRNIGRKINNG